MSQEEEVLTAEEEEFLGEEEYEEELEDEIEEVDDEEEAEEGAFPSPDGEEDEEEDTGDEDPVSGDAVDGPSSGKGGPRLFNPFALLGHLRPANLAKGIKAQRHNLQQLVWQLEDAGVFTAKFAVKFALKAARPALVWLIVSRTMRTLDAARDPRIRMLRQPPNKRIDYYYTQLLGKDWEKQFEQDLLDAIKEVDDGYVTDEIVREKRKLAAVILRRMEVEEWDKQRMRHFYYGLYGMGPWYWDMEERLHNPFFTGARGWNGPIESWVGENQTFGGDVAPEDVDFREQALATIGRARGRPVGAEARRRALRREEMRGADEVMAGRAFRGVLDRAEVRERIDAAAA